MRMGCSNSKVAPACLERDDTLSRKNTFDVKKYKDDNRHEYKSNIGREIGKPSQGMYKAKLHSSVSEKYIVLALIGKGSFSRVMKVKHKDTKHHHAMKLIDTNRRNRRRNADCELSVLRRVRHPNIVQITEVFDASNRIYIIMDLATGGDLLSRILSEKTYSEIDAVTALNMILDAVRYLHNIGVTHRNLKPENILYFHPQKESKLVITDFGFASANYDAKEVLMTTACGTPEYIAPEVLMRQGYTNKVDCWSIGAIAYVLLSGTLPFDNANKIKLCRLILKGECSFNGQRWNGVSECAKDFVKSLLTINPQERASCADALQHPWMSVRSISKRVSKRSSLTSASMIVHHGSSRNFKSKELDDLLKKYNEGSISTFHSRGRS